MEGLCLALVDWSAELRLLQASQDVASVAPRLAHVGSSAGIGSDGQGCRELARKLTRRCNGSTGAFPRNQAWGLCAFLARNTMRSYRPEKRKQLPMFLIDSHGKRPVCLACHRIGPYQRAAAEAFPGGFICAACEQAADAHLQKLAETIPELRDHRLRRWRMGCDCERCGDAGTGQYKEVYKRDRKFRSQSERKFRSRRSTENYARMPDSVLYDSGLSLAASLRLRGAGRFAHQGTIGKIGSATDCEAIGNSRRKL